MFERDHIMRQVNQLAQALARVLSLKSESQYAEAVSEIDAAIGEIEGLDLRSLTDHEIRNRMRQDGSPILLHGPEIGALLIEKGDLLARLGEEEEATRSRHLALSVYRGLLDIGRINLPWDVHERIGRLDRQIGESDSSR